MLRRLGRAQGKCPFLVSITARSHTPSPTNSPHKPLHPRNGFLLVLPSAVTTITSFWSHVQGKDGHRGSLGLAVFRLFGW